MAAIGDASIPPPSVNKYNPDSSTIEVPDGLGGVQNIQIQKMTATAHFGCPLDLKLIAFKCRYADFNPRRHGALTMRLTQLQTVGVMFASGKLIITEADSIAKAESACKEFRLVIEKIGFKPKEFGAMDFKIKNVMGTANVGFPIKLEELSYAHSDYTSYEPEVFPGLVYRMDRTEVVILVFSSGKIVLTGSRKRTDLKNAYTKFYPILMQFKAKYSTKGSAPTSNQGTPTPQDSSRDRDGDVVMR
ncbi:unnamed protein product [Cylindrotheca closterium]|uniref:TATA-box-binding protein n=1 Tax=Cylindrotheca closterium TaxID=2856 RepID=A0AAD2FEU6_9STRA|nr:unnamed protein product [Cylindrotheca closterium]